MNKNIPWFLALLFAFLSCNVSEPEKEINPSLVLWYNKPAAEWTDALPVGNGRLGAMVYGRSENEIIQFNEESLWTGQPHDYAHKGAFRYLDNLRQLLWDGQQKEAQALANEHFMSQPLRQQVYQPFGNVLLHFSGHDSVENYKRLLDLENAVATVKYKTSDAAFKREIFSSYPDQALVIRLESSKNKALTFTAGLNSPHAEYSVSVEGKEVVLKGKANDNPNEKNANGFPFPKSKLHFEARLKIINEGGEIVQNKNSIQVVEARNATLILTAATNFENYGNISADPSLRCSDVLKEIEGKSYKNLRSEHINDYSNLFKRVELDLGDTEVSMRPTNERLVSFKADEDPSLVALLFQYGRYLLISSSRPGTQPANLQGIWNEKLSPPWGSKYTININTEMNYWPAEITNLSECAWPLIRMVEDLAQTGQNVAKEHYGQEGWVTHHNTDLWRGAAPINNSNHGIWPTGGAWLSQNLWWHYQFSGDLDYLENTAYPALKEASRFFTGYLIPYPENPEWLVSGPSNSPENGGLVMGPTMDHQIIRELFSNTIEAAEILGMDTAFVSELKDKRTRIAPNQIGKFGQLQEWIEDKDNPENQHRHVSHLWGLHPGSEIHPLTTPELAEASKMALEHRGDGGTGWSRAWKINFWARLLDGDHAFLLLKNLMVPSLSAETNYQDKGGLYFNLFDAHPPFQIDGNFGATSGIVEMLLQSHLRDKKGDFYLDILPALPSFWATGSISGLKARGGFEVAIDWNNSKLNSVKVKSLLGNEMNLRYNGNVIQRETTAGQAFIFKAKDF